MSLSYHTYALVALSVSYVKGTLGTLCTGVKYTASEFLGVYKNASRNKITQVELIILAIDQQLRSYLSAYILC